MCLHVDFLEYIQRKYDIFLLELKVMQNVIPGQKSLVNLFSYVV